MSDTMDDILKALEIISSGATNLVNANYNKEIAINKSNQAIKLHKLTQEANNDRHNLTYQTNSLNKVLSNQENELVRLTTELDGLNVNWREHLNIDSMDKTLAGNELWAELKEEKNRNLMTWGENQEGILDSIGSLNDAKAVNAAKIGELNAMLSASIEGANKYMDVGTEQGLAGIKDMEDFEAFYDENYTLQGALNALGPMFTEDGGFDPELLQEGALDQWKDNYMEAGAEAYRGSIPDMMKQSKGEIAFDKEAIQYSNAQLTNQKLRFEAANMEDMHELNELTKHISNMNTLLDNGQLDALDAYRDRFGLDENFMNITADADDWSKNWTVDPKLNPGALPKTLINEIEADIKRHAGLFDWLNYGEPDDGYYTNLSKGYQQNKKLNYKQLSSQLANINTIDDLDDILINMADDMINTLYWANESKGGLIFPGMEDSDLKILQRKAPSDFKSQEEKMVWIQNWIKKYASNEFGGEGLTGSGLYNDEGFLSEIEKNMDMAGPGSLTETSGKMEWNDFMLSVNLYNSLYESKLKIDPIKAGPENEDLLRILHQLHPELDIYDTSRLKEVLNPEEITLADNLIENIHKNIPLSTFKVDKHLSVADKNLLARTHLGYNPDFENIVLADEGGTQFSTSQPKVYVKQPYGPRSSLLLGPAANYMVENPVFNFEQRVQNLIYGMTDPTGGVPPGEESLHKFDAKSLKLTLDTPMFETDLGHLGILYQRPTADVKGLFLKEMEGKIIADDFATIDKLSKSDMVKIIFQKKLGESGMLSSENMESFETAWEDLLKSPSPHGYGTFGEEFKNPAWEDRNKAQEYINLAGAYRREGEKIGELEDVAAFFQAQGWSDEDARNQLRSIGWSESEIESALANQLGPDTSDLGPGEEFESSLQFIDQQRVTEINASTTIEEFYSKLGRNVEQSIAQDWAAYVAVSGAQLESQNIPLEWQGTDEQKNSLLGYNKVMLSLSHMSPEEFAKKSGIETPGAFDKKDSTFTESTGVNTFKQDENTFKRKNVDEVKDYILNQTEGFKDSLNINLRKGGKIIYEHSLKNTYNFSDTDLQLIDTFVKNNEINTFDVAGLIAQYEEMPEEYRNKVNLQSWFTMQYGSDSAYRFKLPPLSK